MCMIRFIYELRNVMIKLFIFDLDNMLWEIDLVIIEVEKVMCNWV